jgi:L-amino acid N-acyltransferase YncA
MLRPIEPEDAPRIAASFHRLSKESRYRRRFTYNDSLPPDELTYLVDVDHRDHEAIIAVDPASGEALGVARYIRSAADREVAEVAVTVVDEWQQRGLGRALLARLTYRARREGVRRFSAFVMSENPGAVRLFADVGKAEWRKDAAAAELIAELPAQRGMGAQLARLLRAAASGTAVPAKTLANRIAAAVDSSPRAPSQPQPPIRTIVVGTDGSDPGEEAS